MDASSWESGAGEHRSRSYYPIPCSQKLENLSISFKFKILHVRLHLWLYEVVLTHTHDFNETMCWPGCLLTSHHFSRYQQAFGQNSWHPNGTIWNQWWPRHRLLSPPKLITSLWCRDLFSTLNHNYGTSLQVPKHAGNFLQLFQPLLPQREQILPFYMFSPENFV